MTSQYSCIKCDCFQEKNRYYGGYNCFLGIHIPELLEYNPCPNHSNKINKKPKRWVSLCKK
jgi:hypothetical protein